MAASPAGALAARAGILVERLGKLHVQAVLRILGPRTGRGLAAARSEFEGVLRDLRTATSRGDARDAALLLGLLWEEAKPLFARAPGAEVATALSERSEEMAWVAAKLLRFVAMAMPEGARRATEAALLSQRLGRLYLLRVAGAGKGDTLVQLRVSGAALHAALDALSRAGTGPAELQLARNQEAFLGPAIERLAGGRREAGDEEAVAKSCDNLLEVMERLVRPVETAP